MASLIPTLQEEFRSALSLSEGSVLRPYRFPEAESLIKVAIGMRRSGKTYFLFQTIRELLAQKVPLERILHLNFEDDRLLPMDHKAMGQMIDAWYTLYPDNHNHCCYLFLDEVQSVEGWALVLRRLLDTKKVQLYVTGSSAKLLSKEIATSLRGRSLAIEIFPYGYSEYLTAHQRPHPTPPFGQKGLDLQRGYLLQYLERGGFPGVQSLLPHERLETLQGYVETVVFRDVVERYEIGNITLLKYLIQGLLKNVGAPFSVNKFYNDIKSQGYKVGKDTLYAYLSYLEDAYLLFGVPLFTESLRHRETTPKKIYAIDPGLVGANTFNFSENYGKLLENLIYLDLRRQGKKVFYYQTKGGYEIDFIAQDLQGKCEMIQVVWETSDPATLERETRALAQAEEELGIRGKLIDFRAYLERF